MAEQDSDRRAQAWRLAERCFELSAAEQALELARAEASDPDVAALARELLTPPQPAARRSFEGERIADYVLDRCVGRGGMGEVWVARQLVVERRVALKLLVRPIDDSDAWLRFQHEAHVQAQIAHPNIARVYSSGVWDRADGLRVPWIAMELVEGACSVTSWAAQGARSLRECVDMLATFAEALGAAHEQGVVHRDVKPSNLLVDSAGRAVVVDFGIAQRATSDASARSPRTRTGQILGTPEYMAPERVDPSLGPCGARMDVYALGLVLHELAVGEPRFRSAEPLALHPTAWLRSRMSTVTPSSRALPRDLEAIVAKATAFELKRRYSSCSELADDLRRFQRGEAPRATPETSFDRLRFFLRRNRVAAVIASVLVVGALVGAGGVLWGKWRAVRAEERALQRDRELASSFARVESILSHFEPGLEANTSSAANDFGEQLELAYAHRATDEDEVPWRVHALFGRLFRVLRRPEKAVELLTKALDALDAENATATDIDTVERVEIRRALGHALLELREFDSSRKQFQLAREECEPRTELAALVPQVLCDLGQLERLLGDDVRAVVTLRRALELELSLAEPSIERIEHVRFYLGSTLEGVGELDEAEALLTQVKQSRLARLGCGSAPALSAAMVLARIHQGQGKYELGAAEGDEAIRCAEGKLAPDNRTWLTMQVAYSVALQHAGRWGEAREVGERGFANLLLQYGPDHPEVLTAAHNLAVLASASGDEERARELLEDVLRRRQSTLPHKGEPLHVTSGMLGRTLARLGRFQDAERRLRDAYEGLASSPSRGPNHEETLTLLGELAGVQQDAGHLDESERSYLAAIEGLSNTLSPSHPKVVTVRANLATLYSAQERHELAVQCMREVVESLEQRARRTTPNSLAVRNNVAFNLLKQGRAEEALHELREALALWPDDLPRHTPAFASLFVNLGRACVATGRADEARVHLGSALEAAGEGSRQHCDALEMLRLLDG